MIMVKTRRIKTAGAGERACNGHHTGIRNGYHRRVPLGVVSCAVLEQAVA